MHEYSKYLPFLFLSMGYIGCIYSVFTMLQSISAKKWKKTTASITSANMDTSCDEDGCTYKAKINYSYTYKNRNYSSGKIAFGYMANSIYYLSKRILNKFSRGNVATIYINPRNPKSSVLLVGIRPFHLFNIIFFIVFSVLATKFYNEEPSNKLLKSDDQPLALLAVHRPLAKR